MDNNLCNILSYNCYGLNSALHSLSHFMEEVESNITFISEHWLRPNELSDIGNFFGFKGYQSFLKSSIDPTETLKGRPYGGVGFICKLLKDIVFNEISIDHKRISAIQVLNHGNIIMTIFGVYMPHYDGSYDQIRLYSETIDALQYFIDDCESSPIMIVGDFNATLPRKTNISRNWYKSHPFNTHSLM